LTCFGHEQRFSADCQPDQIHDRDSRGIQTYWISLCGPGAFTSTGGVRVNIGDAPVATSSSALLPFNWIQQYKVTPGQKVSALRNDGVAGTLVVVELTN